jgi:hypothetical protein
LFNDKLQATLGSYECTAFIRHQGLKDNVKSLSFLNPPVFGTGLKNSLKRLESQDHYLSEGRTAQTPICISFKTDYWKGKKTHEHYTRRSTCQAA